METILWHGIQRWSSCKSPTRNIHGVPSTPRNQAQKSRCGRDLPGIVGGLSAIKVLKDLPWCLKVLKGLPCLGKEFLQKSCFLPEFKSSSAGKMTAWLIPRWPLCVSLFAFSFLYHLYTYLSTRGCVHLSTYLCACNVKVIILPQRIPASGSPSFSLWVVGCLQRGN